MELDGKRTTCFHTLLQTVTQGHQDMRLDRFEAHQLEWAVETGVGPLLYWASQADPHASASPAWSLLHSADLMARVLTGELGDAMTDILDACAGQVQTITLLKGITLCEQYYPLPHLRPMRDIDILVDDTDLPVVEDFLVQLGYERESDCDTEFYETHHHSMPFIHPDSQVWIEVHRRVMSTRYTRGKTTPDPLFDRLDWHTELRPAVFRDRPVTRLSDEFQVVYLAAHWAYEFRAVGGVIALLDMIFLLQQTQSRLDWDKILNWLPGSMAATPLYLLVSYLSQAQLIHLPSHLLQELFVRQRAFGKRPLSILHTVIDRYFVEGQTFGPIASLRNVDILWKTLLLPGSPTRNLLLFPLLLLLPWQLRKPLLVGNM